MGSSAMLDRLTGFLNTQVIEEGKIGWAKNLNNTWKLQQ
jgi:hypothetical protein